MDVEVEDVSDLEVCPVYENEVATDENVHMTRRRRGKHDFQFMRARLHAGAKLVGHIALSDKEALLPRRQAIALGEAGRQMAIMRVIPLADVAVMVAVRLTPFVPVSVSMAVVVIPIAVVISVVVVVTIVFVVPMVVILGNSE